MRPWSRQERSQRGDDGPTDVQVHIGQRSHYRLSALDGGFWGERYVQGRLYLHVHFSVWVDEMHPPDATYWCLGFNGAPQTLNQPRSDAADVLESSYVPKRSGKDGNDGVQEAVLVDAVQLMDDPKRVAPKVLSPVVRLQPLDHCLRVWVPTSNLVESASRSRVPVLLPFVELGTSDPAVSLPVLVPEDGEFRAISEFLRQRLGERAGERIGKVVESRSEVVQDISYKETDRVSRWIFGGCMRGNDTFTEPNSCRGGSGSLSGNEHGTSEVVAPLVKRGTGGDGSRPSGFEVIFVPDGVVVATNPTLDLRVQIHHVLERPTHLQLMVERSIRRSHVAHGA